MDTTTQRDYDDELAQEAPLVPDLGRSEGTTIHSDSITPRRPTGRRAETPPTTPSTYDDELAQEAPLVPHLGRTDGLQETADDTTDSSNR